MYIYSVFPLYGEAAVIVVTAENLGDALSKAFGCNIESIARFYSALIEAYGNDKELSYEIVGAYGARDASLSILCSATVITYSAKPEERHNADVLSVEQVTKEKHLYEFNKRKIE